ncbi:MAG: serine/threonine protein kinase, partial [Myxococcota bacterium]
GAALPEPASIPFGKYQLLSRIAAGGMAEIYRARMEAAAGITKPVVIKKILPHFAGNKSFVSMFINEAKITVGLSHGNIAQVFDFGEIDGEYFLAMEYVHGHPLSGVLTRLKTLGVPVVPTPFAVLIALEVCKGLHYAHTRLDEKGQPLHIIHRDVSPQNVILSYEGQVKLVDFGIAKARHATRDDTVAGAVKGKYVYFAPEQAKGKELDARTDVFSTGTVLYEMLCGRLPFEGRMMEVLGKIVRCDFPRPRALNPDITPALERILLSAMTEAKADRYPNAEAFQEALATYLYTHAPTFAAGSLGLLMQYLFEEELIAEGLPVRLPPDFLEQVPLWKKTLPSPQKSASAERATQVARRKSKQSLPSSDEDTQTDSEVAPSRISPAAMGTGARARKLPRALFWGLPLFTFSLAAFVVVGVGQLRTRPAEKAPALPTPVAARQNEPPPKPAPVGPPLPAPSSSSLAYPIHRFEVDATTHAFAVPSSNSARMRLDPRKTYRVWTEGKLALSSGQDALDTNEVLFFLEGSALGAGERFGILGPKPRWVKKASALYAFVLGDGAATHPGSLKVRLQERRGAKASTLLVDSKEHTLLLEPAQRLHLTGLDPRSTYELSVKEAEVAARSGAGQGSQLSKVACRPALGLMMLEAGRRYTVTGTPTMIFTFPDDDLSDNAGSLVIELTERTGR